MAEHVHSGGGHDPPKGPISAERAAVDRVVRGVANDLVGLENETIGRLMPALRDARAELAAGLAKVLEGHDGSEKFTAQQFRAAMVSLDGAMEAAGDLDPALKSAYDYARSGGAALAAAHVKEELARFGAIFGESIRPPQIRTAAILSRTGTLLVPKHRTSAARYAGAVKEDIRHQLAVALAKGETYEQMTRRLVKLGGPRGPIAMRGLLGDPRAAADTIAEGLFTRHRYWAERLVRTEVGNAYNLDKAAAIDDLNADLDDDEEPFLYKWDAAADRRRCPICADLDGRVAVQGETFKGGHKRPPAHPNCRCALVAWHASWGGIKGEIPEVAKQAAAASRAAGAVKAVEDPAAKAAKAAEKAAAKEVAKAAKAARAVEVKAFRKEVAADFKSRVVVSPGSVTVDGREMSKAVLGSDGKWYNQHKKSDGDWHVSPFEFRSQEEATAAASGRWLDEMKAASLRMQPWDESHYRKAVADDDGEAARQMVRGLLYREGVLPRDALFAGGQADILNVRSRAEMGGADALHYWDGHMDIVRSTWEAGTADVKSPAYSDHIRVMVHEELHGSTRFDRPDFYVGYGATVEEVSVESAARVIAKRAMKDGQLAYGTFNEHGDLIRGAYDPQIADMRHLMLKAYDTAGVARPPWTYDEAEAEIGAMGIRMRSKAGGPVAVTKDDIVSQYVDAMDAPAAVKEAYRHAISEYVDTTVERLPL